jgi:hypothetical protein
MNRFKSLCVASFALAAFAPLGAVHAQAEFVGSWVLDPAQSTGAAAELLPTAGALQITDDGGGKYTAVSEATVGGVAGRSEVTYSLDGKDYATKSTPEPPGAPAVTQAVERVSDTVYKISVKVNGDLIATALNELSADKGAFTQKTTGIGQFAMLTSTTVFRRR